MGFKTGKDALINSFIQGSELPNALATWFGKMVNLLAGFFYGVELTIYFLLYVLFAVMVVLILKYMFVIFIYIDSWYKQLKSLFNRNE